MSFILDALKKSEEERKQASPPSIFNPKAAPPMRRTNGLKPVLWGGFAVFTTFLLLAAGYYTVDRGLISINITVPQQDEHVHPAATRQDSANSTSAPTEQAPVESTAQPKANTSPKSPVPPAQAKMTAKKQPEVSKTIIQEQPKEPQEATTEQPKASQPVVKEDEPGTAVVILEPLPLKKNKEPENSAVAAAILTIPYLDELGPAFRRTVPEFKLAGHVYSDDARLRMVMINNQIARESDVVAGNYILEEIIPDGIVLRSGSVRFRLDSK